MAPVVAASGPSIAEMWKEAEERFFQLTEKRLDYQPASSLEDIVAEIDKRQQPEAMTSGVEGTATSRSREYGRDIARCIKLLGGVAVQGYEMVCFIVARVCLGMPRSLTLVWRRDGHHQASASTLSRCFWIYHNTFGTFGLPWMGSSRPLPQALACSRSMSASSSLATSSPS